MNEIVLLLMMIMMVMVMVIFIILIDDIIQSLMNSVKPGYSISSLIKINSTNPTQSDSQDEYRFVSFPTTSTTTTPSFVMYNTKSVRELSEKMPVEIDESSSITFLIYAYDSL